MDGLDYRLETWRQQAGMLREAVGHLLAPSARDWLTSGGHVGRSLSRWFGEDVEAMQRPNGEVAFCSTPIDGFGAGITASGRVSVLLGPSTGGGHLSPYHVGGEGSLLGAPPLAGNFAGIDAGEGPAWLWARETTVRYGGPGVVEVAHEPFDDGAADAGRTGADDVPEADRTDGAAVSDAGRTGADAVPGAPLAVDSETFLAPGTDTLVRQYAVRNPTDRERRVAFVYHARANVNDALQTFGVWNSSPNVLEADGELHWRDRDGPTELRVRFDRPANATGREPGGEFAGGRTAGTILEGRLRTELTVPAGGTAEVAALLTAGEDPGWDAALLDRSPAERRARVEEWWDEWVPANLPGADRVAADGDGLGRAGGGGAASAGGDAAASGGAVATGGDAVASSGGTIGGGTAPGGDAAVGGGSGVDGVDGGDGVDGVDGVDGLDEVSDGANGGGGVSDGDRVNDVNAPAGGTASDAALVRLARRSVAVLGALSDPESGSISASPNLQPTYYPCWPRDAAFAAVALARAGRPGPARGVLAEFLPRVQEADGRFRQCYDSAGRFAGVVDVEADQQPQYAWAVAEVAALVEDPAFLEATWPAVLAALRYTVGSIGADGLLAPTPDVDEYPDAVRQSLWTNAWAYRGLLDGAALARRVGADSAPFERASELVGDALAREFFDAEPYVTYRDAGGDHHDLHPYDAVALSPTGWAPAHGVADRLQRDLRELATEDHHWVPGRFLLAAALFDRGETALAEDLLRRTAAMTTGAGHLVEQPAVADDGVVDHCFASPLAWAHAAFLLAMEARAEA